MRERWSVRGLVTWALLISFASALPVFAIAYLRLFQLRSHARTWAELAQASRWLGIGAICGGADGAKMAEADLNRWRDAVAVLETGSGRWLQNDVLRERLAALQIELGGVLRGPESGWTTWARGHCDELAQLSSLALAESIHLGLDPAARADRFEDIALRDITAYLAVWLMLAVALVLWMRRLVVRPARRLARVMQRIADGDLSARVPVVDGGEMLELATAVQRAVQRFEQRDRLKAQKIVEVRDLVRRLIELIEQPVLVIGIDQRIDYANQAAAVAFGEKQQSLEGAELARLPGGEAVMTAVDEIVRGGEATADRLLSTHPLRQDQHVARCAVVRDPVGVPSRVIMVLKSAEGAWWRRLFRTGSTDEAVDAT